MKGYKILPNVHFGNVNKIKDLIDDSHREILLLTSPSILAHLNQSNVLTEIRRDHNLSVYSEVLPNAPLNMLNEIVSKCKKPDCIIAVGGGSTIDSGKALSVAWSQHMEDFFYKRKSLEGYKINLIAVPTTAGTGAELSYGAILEDTKNKKKGGLRGELIQPSTVLIDFQLYKSAPDQLMAESGFDCLTHAIETFLSVASTPLVEYQSINAIRNVFNSLPEAVATRSEKDIECMAITSSLMGVNLALSSTCLPHRIQYVIGPRTNTSHAQGLIMLYNGWLPIISKTEKFMSLSRLLGYQPNSLVNKILEFKVRLGIDISLSDFGIKESEVSNLAMEVTGNVEMDPCYSDINTIKDIISNSL
ncbi:iron-containing alcohol dehydrogenase family protein [Ekhidna sp.]|uniref:iron-containing alcohol dehydrogenase family protein n=1 Tax=Ekhidna sp. TaxID=2608089 RepID=UPI003CCC1FD0